MALSWESARRVCELSLGGVFCMHLVDLVGLLFVRALRSLPCLLSGSVHYRQRVPKLPTIVAVLSILILSGFASYVLIVNH